MMWEQRISKVRNLYRKFLWILPLAENFPTNEMTAEVEEGTLDGFNCGRGKENIIKGRDMCAVTISETHPTMPAYLSNKWNDGEDQAFFEGSERTVKLKALLA